VPRRRARATAIDSKRTTGFAHLFAAICRKKPSETRETGSARACNKSCDNPTIVLSNIMLIGGFAMRLADNEK